MTKYDILKRPLITEKSTLQKEMANQLSFEVDRKANKVEIKKAIEAIFNVKVRRVCTRWKRGKRTRIGLKSGFTAGWKEAVIHLRPGEKIDVY